MLLPSIDRRVLLSLLLCLSGCMTAPARDPSIWLGQIAPGGGIVDKSVHSWKAMKFNDLVAQQTDFSCGAAAAATIFNYAYGKNTTERQVLVNMLKVADPDIVREKGFSLLDMKNYAEAIGMSGEGYSLEFHALRQLKVPVIVLLNIKQYKHFVVLRKVVGDQVFVGDPALGNRTMGRKDFEAAWNKVVFVFLGEGYVADNILTNPPPPLSAARLFGLRSPVLNAEIYDFGLGPAFHFVL
jgi:predicted double-glycine peptidase